MTPDKKIFISIILALCSAFQSHTPRLSRSGIYYWFSLTSNYARYGPPPAAVKNKDVSHGLPIAALTTNIPDPGYTGCYGTTYYCMACFTSNQLTAAHYYLKTSLILSQMPAASGGTK